MRIQIVTGQETKDFNILTKLYKLTKDGDIKISNYYNKYVKSVSVNKIYYIKPVGT